MQTELMHVVPVSNRRLFLCGAAVLMMAAPAVIMPAGGLVAVLSAALAVAFSLLPWPRPRMTLAMAGGAAAGVSLLADLVYAGPRDLLLAWLPFEMTALLVLLGRVVRGVPARQVVWVATATGLAAVLLPLRFTLRREPVGTAESVVGCSMAVIPAACAIGIGLYLRSLENQRKRAVAQARRDQRLEMAGDLHDFVAHEVTGMLLEVQAAQVEGRAVGFDPEQTRALLARLEEAGLRALDSMDHTVGALRRTDHDGADRSEADGSSPARSYNLTDLPELVSRFAASGTTAGANTRLEMDDDLPGTLAGEIEDTMYRLVLEALTNVRRHAPGASEIVVSAVCVADTSVEVSVTDDCDQPTAPTRHGGGTGLVGLGERFTMLGGTLSAGPRMGGGGWSVKGVLPISDRTGLDGGRNRRWRKV
ncbi:sensor histidine kinase [Streptomyces caelestis]|uniref:sensor histidine kinase n=1 Tax=Streptomyces caelestis TaxID=36816 RepID=UPI0036F5F41D